LHKSDPDDIRHTYQVDLIGVVDTVKYFLPYFLERNTGILHVVSAIAGLVPAVKNMSIYTSSKFALVGFIRSLAWELIGTSVKTSVSCPGGIKSKLPENALGDSESLKKFFDQIANKYDIVLPNRRLLAGGDIVYGRKRVGKDTLRTLVLPVDTSSSISKDQIKVFLEEVWRLSTTLDIDQAIIIYCSDDIDSIDIVKKGQKPDLTKIASTGGNAKGFLPPFQWMQKNKIDPTVVIYLTDSFAQYPSVDQFGINKYKDRVSIATFSILVDFIFFC
jgi:hypothetical protein